MNLYRIRSLAKRRGEKDRRRISALIVVIIFFCIFIVFVHGWKFPNDQKHFTFCCVGGEGENFCWNFFCRFWNKRWKWFYTTMNLYEVLWMFYRNWLLEGRVWRGFWSGGENEAEIMKVEFHVKPCGWGRNLMWIFKGNLENFIKQLVTKTIENSKQSPFQQCLSLFITTKAPFSLRKNSINFGQL
jgi:hypothetical protein